MMITTIACIVLFGFLISIYFLYDRNKENIVKNNLENIIKIMIDYQIQHKNHPINLSTINQVLTKKELKVYHDKYEILIKYEIWKHSEIFEIVDITEFIFKLNDNYYLDTLRKEKLKRINE